MPDPKANFPLIKLAIVTPVFDDWTSFLRLITDLEAALQKLNCRAEIIAVDDCSSERPPTNIAVHPPISRLRILSLASNLGHQRAIAVGLSSAVERAEFDLVAVLDSDGEDRPHELIRLIEAALEHPGLAVVARRAKRSEGWTFRVFYFLHTVLFRILTGHKINFGNFCVLPFAFLDRLTARPDIWNNFAATIIRARLPLKYISTTRGARYAGQSKMNFVSLIVHGLGTISVFSDIVFVRILCASSVLFGLSVLSILVVIAIRLFTALAIPGWATSASGFLILIGFQAVMLPIMMAFLLLNSRASLQPIPKDYALSFVRQSRIVNSDLAESENELSS
jgi:polyisoprenyl-phosphate glycosyltransferase